MSDDPKTPMTQRLVLGFLPEQFPAKDAPTIIALAATTMALMAASGKNDAVMIGKLFDNAVEVYRRLPDSSRESLMAVGNELVECMQMGKHFMVMGGFKSGPPVGPDEPEQEPSKDAAKRPNVVGNA